MLTSEAVTPFISPSDEADVQLFDKPYAAADTDVVFWPYPASALDTPVHARFEEMARRYADRVAVRSSAECVTYAGLNRAANRIAHALVRRLGAERVPVVLLLDKGVNLFAAMLGVLKAGQFYVPLSPSYPPARNRFIAADAG
ncbi:MAG: AMP-binding protein, partial [Gemmataceae bacterium]|nr:AMP-binding protein [Gemmataceae bacterium]